ncbi:hypothetical protein QWY96_16515 [Vibrio artabrorum]|uniref:Uncharacterized protein n=1 Tax=Vibrio artabrorum TaxID=446374 RepID=A0ABT8CK51_9VIBR|nr:hypothetical protein [Vibrio artabrorum]MDN3702098.1 hypothetical protein [Vibrio artabrorum]
MTQTTDWLTTDIGSFAPLQRGFDLPNRERVNGDYPVVYSNGVMNFHHKYQVKGPGLLQEDLGQLVKFIMSKMIIGLITQRCGLKSSIMQFLSLYITYTAT